MNRTINYFFLLLLSLLFIQPSFALAPIQNSDERFHPQVATAGMVVTQEQLASEVGREILAKGGNAVDAAVAVGFALAVTLPKAGNLAGGGFMLIWLADKKQAVAIDYRESAPKAASVQAFLDKNGDIDKARLQRSYAGAGVPGTVAGLSLALEKYGTMSLHDVIQPAIRLAKNGIVVTDPLLEMIHEAKPRLMLSAESRATFFNADGSDFKLGDRLYQPELAASLNAIAKHGAYAFYQGSIAHKIAEQMKQNGGLITLADLAEYKAEVVPPVEGFFHGYRVISMPPPSSGGVTLIALLNILEQYPLKQLGVNNARSIHLLIEAMNFTYNDRNHYLGDPRFVKMPIERLISKKYATQLKKRIDPWKHTPSASISKVDYQPREGHDTTHYSIIDKWGNAVANTYSLNFSFGSGIMVPDTGILLNNVLDDFAIIAGKPNAYGLVQGEANLLQAGKRPLSSMTPTIILHKTGQLYLVTGSPGGSQIITTVLQVIVNVIEHQLNIATAVNMPRVHSQLWPDKLSYEQGLSKDTIALLKKMGHSLQESRVMGAAQTAMRQGRLYFGAADPRRQGALAIGLYA